jgi:hypothetical protein
MIRCRGLHIFLILHPLSSNFLVFQVKGQNFSVLPIHIPKNNAILLVMFLVLLHQLGLKLRNLCSLQLYLTFMPPKSTFNSQTTQDEKRHWSGPQHHGALPEMSRTLPATISFAL